MTRPFGSSDAMRPEIRGGVGFTGTRKHLSNFQLAQLRIRFTTAYRLGARTFHHGGAIGADSEAHRLALELGFDIVVHPDHGSLWATEKVLTTGFPHEKVTVLPEADSLERNRAIVAAVPYLIACPDREKEVRRSGTWATIRYARQAGLLIRIIAPTRSWCEL